MLVFYIQYGGRLVGRPVAPRIVKVVGTMRPRCIGVYEYPSAGKFGSLTPEGSEKCLSIVCKGAPLMFKITKEGGPRARKFGHQVLGVADPSSTSFCDFKD